jgi:hypothetical protein
MVDNGYYLFAFKPNAGNECLSFPNVTANIYQDVVQRDVQTTRATFLIIHPTQHVKH